MKDEIKDNVKEKIINSAVEIVSQEGIDEMTTRKIATNSGVNVASINYYFGSKDKLILEVINFLFEHKVPDFFKILDEYLLEEKIYRFFRGYINELSKHPGVIKTLITAILKGKPEIIEKILFIKKLLEKMQALIAEHTGINDMNLITIMIMHTMSAILFPMAMYKFYPRLFDNLTIADEKTRLLYINTLLKNTLKIDVEKYSEKYDREES